MKESIKCPNCGEIIDIAKSISEGIKRKFQQEFDQKLNEKRAEYLKAVNELKQKELNFSQKLKNATDEALKKEKDILVKELEAKFKDENLLKFETLTKELNEKSAKIAEFNKQSAEFEALKRKFSEMEAEFKAKSELEISKRLNEEKERLKANLLEQNEIRFKELESKNELKQRELIEKNESLIKQIDELKRRSDVTSQQLRGEVMELSIEDYLKEKFIYDEISEVKKGFKGADCLQIVNAPNLPSCARILYESKRTKSFSSEWIAKFKADMIEAGADAGILVTETMPKDMDRLGIIDGVWVCSFAEFKSLCEVMRESVINIAFASKRSQNATSKMGMLYNYLTSNEFKMQVESIISSFVNLQANLDRERRSMERVWKERQKQIEIAQTNAISMHASIRAIAGNDAIEGIEILELPYDE
ncbi:DUF2130 domain-containing protein [Campylobacter corcagiensis]|uniref:DUF2130 domain-containing protein n=1 Tax=Campylobacter corcagiensis TaxID=1448857 RepID=A0A7M1LJA2_9BACT|nr:DUF2130 domain-containing protein [Campylobacter corcagiensis]QKF64210.1 DUF2130 domain-containing protein [Campylobacter corcagiensis]QOQ87595.1 DUF2130 domain-containing protein [Campylobacter corcagiensis]